MMKRLLFDLAVLLSVLYLPWWVAILVGFSGAFLFASYYEIFIFGLLADLLYGTSTSTFHGLVGMICSIVIYVGAWQTRKFVRPSF